MIRLPMLDTAPPPTGRDHWRSVEELADTPGFRAMIEREFPEQAGDWSDPVSRRRFLTLMGASLALGGVTGCNTREPAVKIVPYVRKPEGIVPGIPQYYATAMPQAGGSVGVLVESYQGRPTKIEGNPQHPSSLGATSAIVQASILGLYDPDRSQAVTYMGRIRGWDEAGVEFQKVINTQIRPKHGRGFRILTETPTSPTLSAQIDELLRAYPEAKWHIYEPSATGAAAAGAAMAFGQPLTCLPRFAPALRVLTFDADPFTSGPGHLRNAREFMSRRRQRTPAEMNRLYAVESMPTGTGLTADHRLALPPDDIERMVRDLAARFGIVPADVSRPAEHKQWLDAVAEDLRQHSARSLVIAGDNLTPSAHALVAAINSQLRSYGATIDLVKPDRPPSPDAVASLRELNDDMAAGRVEVLLILGGNPVFTAPADFEFAANMQRVPMRIRLGLYDDETSRLCQWHIPEAHYLESWSDTRADDGTATIIQPLIAPLFGGRTAHEVVGIFTQPTTPTDQEIVKAHWQRFHRETSVAEPFDLFWRRSVHDGVVPGTAFAKVQATLQPIKPSEPPAAAGGGLSLVFRPDPTIHDGRYANNAWLQELPKPITKLTWDNAAIMSPRTAAKLGFANTLGWHGGSHGETLAATADLAIGDRTLAGIPVLILPGHADDTVTLHYGYGRPLAGRVGKGAGFDAYPLRTSSTMSGATGAKLSKAGKTYTLAVTQAHHAIKSVEAHKRGLVRTTTLDELLDPHFHLHHSEHDGPLPSVAGFPQKPPVVGDLPNDMYPAHPDAGHKWGMVIDLSSCTGCSACVAACQAENNIPSVGKDQVTRGREMHWLRIDQYHSGDPEDSSSIHAVFEPVACMHCENAPCEVVCPVAATAHSPDGLNEMIYNRCVGTRYCSNNCPYKVRRFNFLLYADFATESLKSQRNPEVTVRSRGVMEKCTFCVQRIRHAEITARNERRDLLDGEVVTACQAVCPTQAITFGDMNDKTSRVFALKKPGNALNFGLLSDLNTRPRLTYHAAVKNPNPRLKGADHHG